MFTTAFLMYAVEGSEVIHIYRLVSMMKRSVYTRDEAFNANKNMHSKSGDNALIHPNLFCPA